MVIVYGPKVYLYLWAVLRMGLDFFDHMRSIVVFLMIFEKRLLFFKLHFRGDVSWFKYACFCNIPNTVLLCCC
jgi:hypothetical protein